MSNRNTDSTQGDIGHSPAPPGAHGPPDPRSRSANTVFKSGPLFISSKGIGWTSWKKRWFILTRTSLVFFRTDPNAVPQKGSEVNLTLGGIDLNNSGSVVIKEDKKLLTVLFPDGRDGRAFTLKAETLDDLHEWKEALENALKQAPNAALGMGQNGILNNDQNETTETPADHVREEEPPMKSMVVGRPILLALEDIDGSPSFLEKALRFIEVHGVKVEGILRQAAAVDDVEHRVQDYEKGKCEFSPEEDAHIIADCVKYILRELPSSPVPASCCNALLEACRTERSNRVNAMRGAICETFPEPNRRLLQRILTMMQTVAANKAANRMSTSAVAACMAPLLLRPLLAGDCELESDFDVGGDGSIQLLQAAAAANHAQAIVITLLDEYDSIFGEGSLSPEMYTDTEGSESGSEEGSYEDESYEDDYEDDEDYESDASSDGETEGESALSCIENADPGDNLYSKKGSEVCSVGSGSPKVGVDVKKNLTTSPRDMSPKHDNLRKSGKFSKRSGNSFLKQGKELDLQLPEAANENAEFESDIHAAPLTKSTTPAGKPELSRRRTAWGRTSARKNLSMESIDYNLEEDVEIQKLEATKAELQDRIAEEAKENATLQASLEKRKNFLRERRVALEQDVKRLQEELQKERNLRAALEAGLKNPRASMPNTACLNEKTKAGLKEIARVEADVGSLKDKIDDLGGQLNQQREQNCNNATDHVGRDNNLDELDTESVRRHELGSVTERDSSDKRTERSSFNRKTDRDSSDEKTARDSSDRKAERDPSDKQTENSHLNQQSDQARDKKSCRSSGTSSKKSGTKGEGSNSTSSALSKITTRIHFLKEKRSQIANELRKNEKDRGSDQSGNQGKGKAELRQSSMQEKHHGSEFQSGNDSDNKELRSSKSLNNFDAGTATDVKPQGKGKKHDDRLVKDRGKRSEGHSVQTLDKDSSIDQSHEHAEKVRECEGKSFNSSNSSSR